MSIPRSRNCQSYTDTISTLVEARATVEGKEATCSVDLPSHFSCQTSAFEKPDDATREQMQQLAERTLSSRAGCAGDVSLSFHTTLVGTQNMEYSAEKLQSLGMTSNCFAEGNDPNHATHKGRAVCYPMREMIDPKGQRVMNTNMRIHADLAVCDLSDEAMPQVMEDLRKVAALNSTQNGYRILDPTDLACRFDVLPHL